MKKILSILTIAICVVSMTSCTDNEKARNYGGTETINLDPNLKVVNVTWKENDIWILTKPMVATDSAETWTFQEKSSMGVYEGKIILVESKQ